METKGIATEWLEKVEAAAERHREDMRAIAERVRIINENHARALWGDRVNRVED